MNIHFSGEVFFADGVGTLFDAVSRTTGVMAHTPCGGRGICGKCVCAVVYGGTRDKAEKSAAEAGFLDGVDVQEVLERCRVPDEMHGQADVRYLCMCGADGASDVFLPDYSELSGAKFHEKVGANAPVVTAEQVTLTHPTLEEPIDTYENIRRALDGFVDAPMGVVCRVSRELRLDKSPEFFVYHSAGHVVDVSREWYKYYFLAVDIGTTTVAVSLRDASDGSETLGDVFENPQRKYGGDVISRMSHAAAGNGDVLTDVIRNAIGEHVKRLCERAGIRKNQIVYATFAGNSVMQHLFAGLDTSPIATSPFFMQTKFGCELRANDPLCRADEYMSPDGIVCLAPLAASYVGGDITMGLAYILAKYPEIKNKNALFMDLGTNGEMCVIANRQYYFAATAAGPALEGAEIEMGMSATDGAIYRVAADSEKGGFDVRTVGDKPAVGFCGSGVIDAVAEAVRVGLIASTGSICEDFDELEDYAGLFDDAAPRVYDREVYESLAGCVDADEGQVYFTDKVKLTAADIRAVQTAKAAISAGIEVLLRAAGISAESLDAVYLAGSFGGGVDVRSAAEIGIIPKACVDRVHAVGNTSLAGAAAYMFDKAVRDNLREVMDYARYTELSSDKAFTDAFVMGMGF